MTPVKIATEQIARETWEATEHPSCRRLEEKLKNAGYTTPSYRTISKWMKRWPKPEKTPKASRPGRKKPAVKAAEGLDDAAPVLTGDPRTKAADVVDAVMKQLPPPDPEQPKAEEQPQAEAKPSPDDELRENLRKLRDAITGGGEVLLQETAHRTYIAAAVIQTIITEMAPMLIPANPEGVARLHLAAAETLSLASAPLDQIGRMREQAMKTIGSSSAEIIEPGAGDPLAEQLNAFKRNAA